MRVTKQKVAECDGNRGEVDSGGEANRGKDEVSEVNVVVAYHRVLGIHQN